MNRMPLNKAIVGSESEWVPFPGGELEGKRPRALCPECREAVRSGGPGARRRRGAALCFECYRLDLERSRALRAAATFDAATEARFQTQLPFEPVNRPRLAHLKAEREAARVRDRSGAGFYVEKRNRAQIEARHALARILHGLRERHLEGGHLSAEREAQRSTVGLEPHALKYPESWLPFVAAR